MRWNQESKRWAATCLRGGVKFRCEVGEGKSIDGKVEARPRLLRYLVRDWEQESG